MPIYDEGASALAEVGRFRRRGRPFDFIHGAPLPGRYPPDELTIAEAVEAIRSVPIEIGYGFDADGRQIFRQVGDPDEIRGFDQRDLVAIADGTFVHNHPPYTRFPEGDPRRRAGSFSQRDLVFMYEYRLAEIIAVTRERTYHLRQLEGLFLDPGQIRMAFADSVDRVTRRLRRLAERGIISIEEAEAEGRIADDVMERIAAFFDYRWEAR
jgi:hypothetical protein